MSTAPGDVREPEARRIALTALETFCRAVLTAAGADAQSTDAAARAMLHGSRLGIDSHGVRLLDHYVSVLEGGRVNKAPQPTFTRTFAAFGRLDNDHGHGALGAYRGMEHAVEIARETGIAAVSIQNTSHFGPAGAYAYAAAQEGFIGLAFCNSDSFVRLHDGAQRFHGTNPIAMAVPAGTDEPWLLDMATSSVPYNRVQLYKSLGMALPENTASDASGADTRDADATDMLAPLGGAFGFKGAGLAGLVEILCSVLSGMRISPDILPMEGADKTTPREMGAFVVALRPDAAVDTTTFESGLRRYLDALRGSAARAGATVLAPGDREWAVAHERRKSGVPIDPATERAFVALSTTYGVPLPFERNERG